MKNVVYLIGRVGSDPEVRTLDGGKKVCSMSLATTETWTNKQGEKESDTQWHRLTIWNKAAEVAEKFVKKGDLLTIDGKIIYRKYTDKEGVDRYNSEIVVSELLLMPNKKD